jgi:transcriptional regulator with XRE-family HTH domain
MVQTKGTFGKYLKQLRLAAGYGLRRFAALIEMKASNLCDIEHDRRAMPKEYVEPVAEALGLAKGTKELDKFFDLAREADSLPADVQHVIRRDFVPALLRTIDNARLSDKDIKKLIDEIQGRKPPKNAPR